MSGSQYLLFRIKSLDNHFKRLMDRTAIPENDANLTGMQYAVLGFIGGRSSQGDVYQRDIEEEFNIRRSTATGILQLLEKRGYIMRYSVPGDARLKRIAATKEAHILGESVKSHITEMEERLVRGISDNELEQFTSVLDRIIANAQE